MELRSLLADVVILTPSDEGIPPVIYWPYPDQPRSASSLPQPTQFYRSIYRPFPINLPTSHIFSYIISVLPTSFLKSGMCCTPTAPPLDTPLGGGGRPCLIGGECSYCRRSEKIKSKHVKHVLI